MNSEHQQDTSKKLKTTRKFKRHQAIIARRKKRKRDKKRQLRRFKGTSVSGNQSNRFAQQNSDTMGAEYDTNNLAGNMHFSEYDEFKRYNRRWDRFGQQHSNYFQTDFDENNAKQIGHLNGHICTSPATCNNSGLGIDETFKNGKTLEGRKEETQSKVSQGQEDKSQDATQRRQSSSSSETDSIINELKKAVSESVAKNKLEGGNISRGTVIHKDKVLQSNCSDFNSTSPEAENDNCVSTKKLKTEKISEDEVVYLGRMERIENLDEDQHNCLICDKMGHTSFQCFMVCRNCGENYHGHKDCPKAANISTVLQNFFEFCLNQCYQYDPEQRFQFNQDMPTGLCGSLPSIFNNIEATKTREQVNNLRSSSERSKRLRRRARFSNSDSSSNENISRSSKRANTNASSLGNNFANHPYNPPFPSMLPFAFNPQGIPFNPQALAINPLLSYTQMMGFNPLPNNVKKYN